MISGFNESSSQAAAVEWCCLCMFVLVGSGLLWWKFYDEHKKREKFGRAFSRNLNENRRTLNESFNETDETLNQNFHQINETSDETFDKTFSETSQVHIPLLFINMDAEDLFLMLSIVATVFTVRHRYQ